MADRGTALVELVLVLPLLVLFGSAICYFGYCQLINIELNALAWEGASQLAKGRNMSSWLASLQERDLVLNLERLTVKQEADCLRLSYTLPKPLWAKDEPAKVTSFSWQRSKSK